MTDNSFWTDDARDAAFSNDENFVRRRSMLERRVLVRNGIEYAAGGLMLVLLAGMTVASVMKGLWPFAISAFALLVGVALVLRHLVQHGRVEKPRPETPCLDHYRAQLVRQRDLLRSVPGWYLFPLVPGLLAFYVSVMMGAMPKVGLAAAFEGVAPMLLLTLGFFLLVGVLNLHAARRIEREIGTLDKAAA